MHYIPPFVLLRNMIWLLQALQPAPVRASMKAI